MCRLPTVAWGRSYRWSRLNRVGTKIQSTSWQSMSCASEQGSVHQISILNKTGQGFQNLEDIMSSMLVGKLAPFFKGQAYLFREGKHQFKQISLDHYKNKYLVLFFYPLNFTFACPTQIIQFNNLALKHANTLDVLGVSVDSKFSHMEYVNKPRNKGGLGGISFPLLSDLSHKISKDYGVLSQDGISFRGTFIIAPDQTIKHSSINFPGIGRNVQEYGRLVEACAHNQKHGQVCPANWQKGDPTMKPDVNSKELNKYWEQVHSKK